MRKCVLWQDLQEREMTRGLKGRRSLLVVGALAALIALGSAQCVTVGGLRSSEKVCAQRLTCSRV